jgi:hypothetical protein
MSSQYAPLKYQYPNWASTWRADIKAGRISLDDIPSFEIENKQVEATNLTEQKRALALKAEIVAMAEAIWGKHSNQVKYIRRQSVPSYYSPSTYDVRKALEGVREEASNVARQKVRDEMLQRAVIWLQEKGKILGKDFTLETAFEVSDDIAFQEAVAEAMPADGSFISFAGDDYCDGCAGWDGKSHRCQCGNRRVAWASSMSHSFENPHVYPEAW